MGNQSSNESRPNSNIIDINDKFNIGNPSKRNKKSSNHISFYQKNSSVEKNLTNDDDIINSYVDLTYSTQSFEKKLSNSQYKNAIIPLEETSSDSGKSEKLLDLNCESFKVEREYIKDNFDIFHTNLTKSKHQSQKTISNNILVDLSETSLKQFNSCTTTNISENEYELKLINRSEKLRKAYINKLISSNAWQPLKKEKTHNTIFIYDWDDTLLCTSYLTPCGLFNDEFELTKKDKEKLSNIEFYVLKILNFSILKGETFIITNASPGWVEYSCKKFYPEIFKILAKIKIISARGEYQRIFPKEIKQWKIHAFLEMKKNFNLDLVANILCMGDSIFEIEAAQILASKFTQSFIKTIKFKEAPKPEELVKQLRLVSDQLDKIFSSVVNLTIRVEKKGVSKGKNFI